MQTFMELIKVFPIFVGVYDVVNINHYNLKCKSNDEENFYYCICIAFNVNRSGG